MFRQTRRAAPSVPPLSAHLSDFDQLPQHIDSPLREYISEPMLPDRLYVPNDDLSLETHVQLSRMGLVDRSPSPTQSVKSVSTISLVDHPDIPALRTAEMPYLLEVLQSENAEATHRTSNRTVGAPSVWSYTSTTKAQRSVDTVTRSSNGGATTSGESEAPSVHDVPPLLSQTFSSSPSSLASSSICTIYGIQCLPEHIVHFEDDGNGVNVPTANPPTRSLYDGLPLECPLGQLRSCGDAWNNTKANTREDCFRHTVNAHLHGHFPSEVHCPLANCTQTFTAAAVSEGALRAWKDFVWHIADHNRAGLSIRTSRLDYNFLDFLRKRKIIKDHTFQFLLRGPASADQPQHFVVTHKSQRRSGRSDGDPVSRQFMRPPRSPAGRRQQCASLNAISSRI